MIVELEGDADDVVAFLLEEAGDDGGIHAPRHGHDNARVFGASRQVEAVHFRCVPDTLMTGYMPTSGI
jgi:hypothetical protein